MLVGKFSENFVSCAANAFSFFNSLFRLPHQLQNLAPARKRLYKSAVIWVRTRRLKSQPTDFNINATQLRRFLFRQRPIFSCEFNLRVEKCKCLRIQVRAKPEHIAEENAREPKTSRILTGLFRITPEGLRLALKQVNLLFH